jgi:gamma-glutamyltranspeptidase/glutathione hydrolase
MAADDGTFTTRPELAGTFGMVASTHWLASAAGMAVLEGGGNAFDAAVAAGFTLQVVEPHLNGPGGEVPVLFAPAGGAATVLCGQGPAPAGASIAGYAALGVRGLVPGTGPLAAAIPGAVPTWLTLLRDHGTRPLREVLRFAIGYAEHGHPLVPNVPATIGAVAELFRQEWLPSAEVYLPGGRPPVAGSLFRNPALAATYRRLLAEAEAAGPGREAQLDAALRAWSQGFVAEAVDKFAARPWMDTSGERHAGVLTGDDLAGWRPGYESPLSAEFGGVTVHKTAQWGQGPVLLQQLAMLERLLDADDPGLGTAGFVHTVVEAAKLAFADREAWYGDADGADAALAADLLDPAYAAARAALVGERATVGELRPGRPGGREPRLPELVGAVGGSGAAPAPGTGEPTIGRDGLTRGDTCHVDVVDRWGNLVSATPSGGWLQSSPVIEELGFPLGTRLQMAWLEPGLPNSLTPGRRPRTTLTPTLLSRDGVAVAAVGTPGGDQQDQWQVGFLLNHLLGGMNLQQAIDAPAFHTADFPSSFHPRTVEPGRVLVEERMGAGVLAELGTRGHAVQVCPAWSLGRLSAVSRDPESGTLRAAANARGMQGYAAGR